MAIPLATKIWPDGATCVFLSTVPGVGHSVGDSPGALALQRRDRHVLRLQLPLELGQQLFQG